ncbi:hypothetical protein [Desulfomicrobium baculatum]|uniref:DUF2116 family Zn-ribbon domain-containing protein n=1 Tax=Desulfomicrobium baculatum (strain DSM 4028 / VKM B-1378 / X) TaxID=525897 RepID=C7LVH7_DESBD|nr:hypothetical protein [Desulfomicrobium baculatum]ACU89733.1 hypothetical protein Dbac_1641 [Desulfomicrobium baculatum DSM 4028]
MAARFCPKCGTRLSGDTNHCAGCVQDAADRRLLGAALILPFLLAVAVVITGLPL